MTLVQLLLEHQSMYGVTFVVTTGSHVLRVLTAGGCRSSSATSRTDRTNRWSRGAIMSAIGLRSLRPENGS